MKGVVAAAGFIPGSSADPSFSSGYFQGAVVCVDANNNGHCDGGETSATTDAKGTFTVSVAGTSPTALIADIDTGATNTATGREVPTRTVLRIAQEQVVEQGAAIAISPISTELVRLMEANGSSYVTEKQNLAERMGATPAQVLADVNTIAPGPLRTAMLSESNALTNRFAYAITKLDRGDLYPDALAVPGGDPELTGLAGVTASTATVADNRQPITFQQSQQAAFEVEGIPRYDHIFIVMLENKGASSILNSAFAPKINALDETGQPVRELLRHRQPQRAELHGARRRR